MRLYFRDLAWTAPDIDTILDEIEAQGAEDDGRGSFSCPLGPSNGLRQRSRRFPASQEEGPPHLDMAFNQLTKLDGIDDLDQFAGLNVSHNRLAEITCLPATLEALSASHNALITLARLPFVPSLTELDVSNNPLSSLTGVAVAPALRVLRAANCALTSFAVRRHPRRPPACVELQQVFRPAVNAGRYPLARPGRAGPRRQPGQRPNHARRPQGRSAADPGASGQPCR